MAMLLKALREQVYEANLDLVRRGLVMETFGNVSGVDRDAVASRAAVAIVLSLPGISSQVIDNLNASIHLRALLTDLFLVDEVLKGLK